ncbi:hypothetical protein A9Q83_18700 [Alphaproteobacteria bacterium 46_93_T64]|nr:hypothetical protein A9Q83_18700 [Alphaproteobacteria bacterium 46_93_T64]
MRVSLYEIATTLRKASIGSGLPVGLADDIGEAAKWLAVRECDCVDPVLTAIVAGMSTVEMHVSDEGTLVFPDARIAVCGPSVIDLLVGEARYNEAYLINADSALLMIGIAGVVAEHHGMEFQFCFSNGAKAQVTADELVTQGEMPSSNCDIALTCRKTDVTQSKPSIPIQGVKVAIEAWRQAENLAAKTYVPESKKSRTGGAGAGLTDND